MSSPILFLVTIEPDGGWYAESVGEEMIVSQGDSVEEIDAMIGDALRTHFDEAPPMAKLHIVENRILGDLTHEAVERERCQLPD